jgi:hypothetical protein
MGEHVIDTKSDGGFGVLRRGLQFLRLVSTIYTRLLTLALQIAD